MIDVISDVLKLIRFSGCVYFKMDFEPEWGMAMTKGEFSQFHIVTRGKCLVKLGDSEPVTMNRGDIVVFPHGDAHWIADRAEAKKIPGRDVFEAYRERNRTTPGETVCTQLVCGHFELEPSLEHPFFAELPRMMLIRNSEDEDGRLKKLVTFIVEETESNGIASDVVTKRLAEALFVLLLRIYVERDKHLKPPWRALSQPAIYRSLQLIHSDPQYDWSLVKIAREIGMSRSLFAMRFRECTGTTPMRYITRWRMHKAKNLLAGTQLSVATIADSVGYASDPAFNRAFKRHFNKTPGEFRKMSVIALKSK